MFWFEFFFISLSLAPWNLWLILNCQGKSWSKMRTTYMGYKYNTINFSHELITKCSNPPFSYWQWLQRKEWVSVNIYLLLHSFCVSCLYITYTNRIINGLLSSFSVFSVDNIHSIHPLRLFSFKATSLWVQLSEFLEKGAIFINCPVKCMYYVVSVSDMIIRSLSAFPLQTLLSEVYNYSVLFPLPLETFSYRRNVVL